MKRSYQEQRNPGIGRRSFQGGNDGDGNGTVNDRGAEVCPSLAELLRVSDGEASPHERQRVSTHLWRCEACRNRLHDAESLALECATVLAQPSPTSETTGQFVAGLRRRRLAANEERAGQGLGWLPMATAFAALLFVIVLSQSQTSIVRADELLDRAARFEVSDSSSVRRAHMRLVPERADQASADVRARPSARATNGALDGTQTSEAILEILRHHGVNWRRPLDLDAIRQWRDSLQNATERVRLAEDQLVLHVQTKESPIASMELVVRASTFEPLRGAFVISGLGRLEVEMLHESPKTDDRLATSIGATAPPPASDAASSRPSNDVLEQVELGVRHALHATRLDLGEALNVSIKQNRVVVDGAVSWKDLFALKARLPRDPNVALVLRPRLLSARPIVVSESSPLSPASPVLTWLEKTFGHDGGDAGTKFLADLSSATTLVAERLDALVALKRRYPASTTAAMSTKSRASFQELLNAHYHDLNGALEQLAGRVAVLRGMSSGLPISLTKAPKDWAARVEPALSDAIHLRELLPALTASDSDQELDDTREAFGTGLDRLWNRLNGYQSSLRRP